VISRTLHLRNLLGPVLGLAVVASASTAFAQEAPTSAPAAAPAEGTAPAAPGTPEEEEEAKKKALQAEGEKGADQTANPATTPGSAAGTASAGVSVSIGNDPNKDTATKTAAPEEQTQAPQPNPFRGSIFIFDQSVTTATLSKRANLSYQPLYEWWLSPRINYNIDKFRFTFRQDLFKEWTNSQETTSQGEWRYTDTWLTAAYRSPIKAISDHLMGAVSFTLRPGISRESRIAGQYLAMGPGVSLAYGFDLLGENAKAFRTASISASTLYQHAFTRCNVACGPSSFTQPRQNTDFQPIDDNQVRAGSLVGNQLLYSLNLGTEIVDHLDFSASMIWVSQFQYRTSDATFGGQEIARSADDTRLRQLTWFLLMLNYQVAKEVGLTIGYYNLNNVLALDGSYRQPFYSREGARVFFDVVVSLDAVYEKLVGGEGRGTKGQQGSGRVF
jgi:hypothetical protein